MSKKELGQFYTTNCEYIFSGLEIPENVDTIIEPFAGDCHLLNFLKKEYTLELYDIKPENEKIIKRDTIANPPLYKNKFILTNPPFLARNKSKNKEYFDKYKTNDLYKCFIIEILTNVAQGGIIITPLNFWSSIRPVDIKLRKKFLEIYNVLKVNIFEERVFTDTAYTVCSFLFIKKKDNKNKEIIFTIYPIKKEIKTILSNKNNYTIGGEIYKLTQSKKYTISRLTLKNEQNTNILVKCIDDTKNSKIKLSYVSDDEIYIDKTENSSARTYATLVITPKISDTLQKKLVKRFNSFLNEKREKYHSLFLTNYRENGRKRISFSLVYDIVSHLLQYLEK